MDLTEGSSDEEERCPLPNRMCGAFASQDNTLVPKDAAKASFVVKKIPGDGDCFWSSLSEAVSLALPPGTRVPSGREIRFKVAEKLETSLVKYRAILGDLVDARRPPVSEHQRHLLAEVSQDAVEPEDLMFLAFLEYPRTVRQAEYDASTFPQMLRAMRANAPFWGGGGFAATAAAVLSSVLRLSLCIVILRYVPEKKAYSAHRFGGEGCSRCIFLWHTGRDRAAHYDVLSPIPGGPLFQN